jgi:hypothetical protein
VDTNQKSPAICQAFCKKIIFYEFVNSGNFPETVRLRGFAIPIRTMIGCYW